MAPLCKAINAEYANKVEGQDPRTVYSGQVDPEWTVISVPNGGYILGLILESAIQYQSSTIHPDPIHVTAHFIRSASVGPFEVHIRDIKTGKGFKNIAATLVQNGEEKVLTHMIFGRLTPPEGGRQDDFNLIVEPPSPYASRIPFHTHPSNCKIARAVGRYGFRNYIQSARDPVYLPNAKIPRKGGGIEWAEYVTLKDAEDRLTAPSMAFFADTFLSLPVILPDLKSLDFWLPTMVMTIEFKFPIPKPSNPHCSQRTVAIFSRGQFVNSPSSRHDIYLEIWTAPNDTTEETDDWKEHQRCLAVATQMAVVVPADVNRKKGKSGTPALGKAKL